MKIISILVVSVLVFAVALLFFLPRDGRGNLHGSSPAPIENKSDETRSARSLVEGPVATELVGIENEVENDELTNSSRPISDETFDDEGIKHLLSTDGYIDPAGTSSDYAAYDTAIVVELAKSGDKRALLEAAIRGELPIADRQKYAVLAAKQGYTSALLRVGLSMMIVNAGSPQSSGQQRPMADVKALGMAYVIAAREMGDVGANSDEVWQAASELVSEEEMRVAGEKAREILRDVQG